MRLARFSYVHGSITWRPSADADWSPAGVNLPLRQGAQVWVTDGGRAEVQFDDGSLLRLGNGAIVTLQTLYSDTDGEYTEIQMNEGLAALRAAPRHRPSFRWTRPSPRSRPPGRPKCASAWTTDVEVAVRDGSAAVEGTAGRPCCAPATTWTSPTPTRPIKWPPCRTRTAGTAGTTAATSSSPTPTAASYLPSNIALVSGDLGDYGSWRDDPQYGHVWCPRVVDTDWRPYQHGHWVWVDPFGWTWVSSEAWGWAPYHYGTWVDASSGWAWVPGPAHQYWCPAVVHFSEYEGNVAWCPLAPAEVRYPPALSLGFRSGGWSLNFSIGGCAVYYPASDHYCEPRPFNNVVVNRTVYVNNVTNVTNVYNINRTTINRNVYETNYHFVPRNAQTAGATTASAAAFGGRGEYRPAPRVATAYFAPGRSIGAPERGAAPVAGPIAVRPTAEAFTPSRTFLPASHPAPDFVQRPMFRAPLPRRVALVAPPLAHPTPRTFRAVGPQDAGANTYRTDTAVEAARRRPFSVADRRRQAAEDARQSLGQPSPNDIGRIRPFRSPAFDNVPRNSVGFSRQRGGRRPGNARPAPGAELLP